MEKPYFKRSGFDRRDGDERREAVNLDVLDRLPFDRRQGNERRLRGENRVGWIRVTRWSSIHVGEQVRFRMEVTGSSLPPGTVSAEANFTI
ncbi:MAG: hypothetical protein AB1568_14045 [Thermodesulfobacteriota bacterium]